jgi:tetratricopeptide (TPR) repeat protein
VDYINRGNAWQEKGDYNKAITDYNQPNNADPYYFRGTVWEKKGEYDKAIADHNRAILLDPKHANAYNNRGAVWQKKGEYDKAITDCNQALALNPTFAAALNNRGAAWYAKGEYDKAITDCNEAIRLDPKDAKAHSTCGNAWNAKGHYDKAIDDFNQAVTLNPNLAAAYRDLAWLHATCPNEKYRDGKKAFENASKAYQLSGAKEWSYLVTLAAAYAENGDFDKAKEWEAKAIELATTDKSAMDKDKAEARSRLELYKKGRPYHKEFKK